MERKAFLKRATIISIVLSLLSYCSQITQVGDGTNVRNNNQGYYTGKPEIKWVDIPGGEYEMTIYKTRSTDRSGVTGQSIIEKIRIDDFKMSAHEITNKQYCMFLNEALERGENIKVKVVNDNTVATGSIREVASFGVFITLKPLIPSFRANLNGSGILYSQSKFKVVRGQEDFPAVNVTGTGAEAFAEFYGLTLPTEAQWEYAASGSKSNPYGPADGSINRNNANFDNNIGHTQKVMSYPPNDYGLFDMCGNATEWCISQLRYNGITKSSIPPARLSTPKGGSWLSFEDGCRIRSKTTHNRFFKYPYSRNVKSPYPYKSTLTVSPRNNNGFRVVTRVINR